MSQTIPGPRGKAECAVSELLIYGGNTYAAVAWIVDAG
jgi:hypothetical protein